MTTFMSSGSVSNLYISGDLGFVETRGHSSRFIQVLDESMCVVREDLTDWLQRYLFSTVDAPPIDAPFLLFRLRSGLWLSRLAYKLQLSVLQKSSSSPPPKKHVLKEKDYNFLRGAVSNQNLRNVSKTSLPPFPQTLVACAGLPLSQPDVCPYSLSTDAYSGDVTTSSSSAYSSSNSPEHSYPHTESSKPMTRIADQWAARDNVSCFIQWCKDLGIPQTVLFETTGLVHRTEEKNVLLTLMELARIASRFGLTDLPELVRMEREIDALEEAFDNKMKEKQAWIDLPQNPTSDSRYIKSDQLVDEGIAEDHDEKSDVFILEPDTGIDLSDSDRTPKPSAPLSRLRSVEATPPITRNRLSRSICTSPLDKSSEKRSPDRTGITTAAFSTSEKGNSAQSSSTGQFFDSTDASDRSTERTFQNSFTQTVGPCGDVGLMDTSHDQEQHDTSSSDAGAGSSENRSVRSADPFVEDQASNHLLSKSRLYTPPHHHSQLGFLVNGKRRASQSLSISESANDGTPRKIAKPDHSTSRSDSLILGDETLCNNTVSLTSPKVMTPPTPVTVLRELRLTVDERDVNHSTQDKTKLKRIHHPVVPPTQSCMPSMEVRLPHKAVKHSSDEEHILMEQVAKKLALCTCCNRLRLQRLEEGRYRLNGRIYYFRRFRNHVMVRIGGGWLTLDAFLNRHDPCRRGKCVPMTGANSQPSSAASSLPAQHHATNSNPGKPPASMSTSMVVLRRRPSKGSTNSDESLSNESGLVPTLKVDFNQDKDRQTSKPLTASHPDLSITPTRPNSKALNNSTSRIPIPHISSRRASAATDRRQQTDTSKLFPRTSRLNVSVDDLSRRRASECSPSRNSSSSIVRRPSLYHSPRSSTVPKNSPLASSRIPLAKQSNPDLTTIARNSRPSTPSSASVVPDRTKGIEASHLNTS